MQTKLRNKFQKQKQLSTQGSVVTEIFGGNKYSVRFLILGIRQKILYLPDKRLSESLLYCG